MRGELINYPEVTLLVTHYNRSKSLSRLLEVFDELGMRFGDVIVSDDCSNEEHLNNLYSLQQKTGFRLITSPENKGLGNNLNKGQEAVQTELTLYVQEDFEPDYRLRTALTDAVGFMNSDKDLDLVRFFAYRKYPYTIPYKNGFSEIYVPMTGTNYQKVYAYSDHPHLRRSSFPCKFGRYVEGIKGDRTEYRMCISFIQKNGRALLYDDIHALFTHGNTATETSTMKRAKISQARHPLLNAVRDSYRQVRYNYDMQFQKQIGEIQDPDSDICLDK
jgi:glycosyltransferase involved in cell wall biosynthesis